MSLEARLESGVDKEKCHLPSVEAIFRLLHRFRYPQRPIISVFPPRLLLLRLFAHNYDSQKSKLECPKKPHKRSRGWTSLKRNENNCHHILWSIYLMCLSVAIELNGRRTHRQLSSILDVTVASIVLETRIYFPQWKSSQWRSFFVRRGAMKLSHSSVFDVSWRIASEFSRSHGLCLSLWFSLRLSKTFKK